MVALGRAAGSARRGITSPHNLVTEIKRIKGLGAGIWHSHYRHSGADHCIVHVDCHMPNLVA